MVQVSIIFFKHFTDKRRYVKSNKKKRERRGGEKKRRKKEDSVNKRKLLLFCFTNGGCGGSYGPPTVMEQVFKFKRLAAPLFPCLEKTKYYAKNTMILLTEN